MATGIDVQGMTALKVSLLDYIELINVLVKRFDDCSYNVGQNISGACSSQIVSLLGKIKDQFPIVISNINSYIGDISKVQQYYENQDEELRSMVSSDMALINEKKGEI